MNNIENINLVKQVLVKIEFFKILQTHLKDPTFEEILKNLKY